MGGFSAFHWLILFLIIVVLFGASRLPKIGQGLGRGIKSFRKEIKDLTEDEDDEEDNDIAIESKRASRSKKKVSVRKTRKRS